MITLIYNDPPYDDIDNPDRENTPFGVEADGDYYPIDTLKELLSWIPKDGIYSIG